MSMQHFKDLYDIAREDGLRSALDHDVELTLERHRVASRVCEGFASAFKDGYGLRDRAVPVAEAVVYLPAYISGAVTRGVSLPIEALVGNQQATRRK